MTQRLARILHVTPQLSLGGAGRAMIALGRASTALGGFKHQAVSLARADPAAEAEARAAGITFPTGSLSSLVAAADIVQVHFWNDPALSRFLHSRLPQSRLLLWAHVRGTTPPHVITPSVLRAAMFVAFSDPESLRIPGMARRAAKGEAEILPAGVDSFRLNGLKRSRSPRVRVGYLGPLHFAKLHPDFVSLSSSVRGRVLFVVAGEGRDQEALKRQVRDLRMEDRFRFVGFVGDIRDFFGQIDILGHPLAPGASSTAELAVQEAMFAGVPPVVLSGTGGSFLVRHGQTGLVATDTRDYVRALESLIGDADLRRTLRRGAQKAARASLTMDRRARQFHRVYDQLIGKPRQVHLPAAPPPRGAEAFASSLGRWGLPFRQSLLGGTAGVAADRRISRGPWAGNGGDSDTLLQFRLAYPGDPYLRLWAGLILEHRRRFALAALEFHAAHQGVGDERALAYLARVRGNT